jgi:hypothetical protein
MNADELLRVWWRACAIFSTNVVELRWLAVGLQDLFPIVECSKEAQALVTKCPFSVLAALYGWMDGFYFARREVPIGP